MKRSEIDAIRASTEKSQQREREVGENNVRMLAKAESDDSRMSDVIVVAHVVIKDPFITIHSYAIDGDWAYATHLSPFQLRNLAAVVEHFEGWKNNEQASPFPDVEWLRVLGR